VTGRKRDGQFDEGIRIKHPRRHDEIAGLKGACGHAYRQFLTSEAFLEPAGPLPVVLSDVGQMFSFYVSVFLQLMRQLFPSWCVCFVFFCVRSEIRIKKGI
jgi:hypothetical protein